MIKQTQLDAGERRDGLSSEEREELRRLRRDVRRLEQERDILLDVSAGGYPCSVAVPGAGVGASPPAARSGSRLPGSRMAAASPMRARTARMTIART